MHDIVNYFLAVDLDGSKSIVKDLEEKLTTRVKELEKNYRFEWMSVDTRYQLELEIDNFIKENDIPKGVHIKLEQFDPECPEINIDVAVSVTNAALYNALIAQNAVVSGNRLIFNTPTLAAFVAELDTNKTAEADNFREMLLKSYNYDHSHGSMWFELNPTQPLGTFLAALKKMLEAITQCRDAGLHEPSEQFEAAYDETRKRIESLYISL